MNRVKIRIIPPSVDQPAALKIARRYRGWLPWQRERVLGVELVFVPYQVFRYSFTSRVGDRRQSTTGLLAADSILGNPVVVQGERISPRSAEVNAYVVYRGVLAPGEIMERVREKAPKLFARLLRSYVPLADFRLEPVDSLYLPYWLGVYRRRKTTYYGIVIDGNRAEIAPGVLDIINSARTMDEP